MLVGLYQNNPIFGEVQQNIQAAADALSAIRVDLVVLPELFNTGYQFSSKEEAEETKKKLEDAGASVEIK